MMRYFKPSVVIFLMFVLHAVQAVADDFEIKFSILKASKKRKYAISSETTMIPLHYKDNNPEFRFGYSIKLNPETSFTTYFVMHFPSQPQQYTGDLKDAAKKSGGKSVQSPKRQGPVNSYRSRTV